MKNSIALFLMAAPSLLYGMFEFGIPLQPPASLYPEAMQMLLFSLLCGLLGFTYLMRAVWVSLRESPEAVKREQQRSSLGPSPERAKLLR